MLLSYNIIVDFHLFYYGAVDIQICALLTRFQCKVSDTQVTVRACGLLDNIYFSKRKFLETVNKCASQNVERRNKSSIIVHQSLTVGPASGRLGVRIPAATDLIVKTGSNRSTAKRSAIDASAIWVLGDDYYKRMPRVTEGVAR